MLGGINPEPKPDPGWFQFLVTAEGLLEPLQIGLLLLAIRRKVMRLEQTAASPGHEKSPRGPRGAQAWAVAAAVRQRCPSQLQGHMPLRRAQLRRRAEGGAFAGCHRRSSLACAPLHGRRGPGETEAPPSGTPERARGGVANPGSPMTNHLIIRYRRPRRPRFVASGAPNPGGRGFRTCTNP